METVLVTGAAGTVGHYVVPLAEAAGYRVVASDLVPPIRTPVSGELRLGDLNDPDFVASVVQGCDHIVHTAAQLDVAASAASLARTNTEALARLYEAASAAGVQRLIHLSTAMLYAPHQSGPLTEQARLAARGPYGMSKHGADVFLTRQNNGPHWTILRPAPLYGRRGRYFAASLLVVGPILRLATLLLPRATGGPVATFVHAEDVASASVFCLRTEATRNRIYNVSDGDPMGMADRLTHTFRAYGLATMPVGSVPESMLRRVAALFSRPVASQAADTFALAAWRLVVWKHGLKPALRPRLDPEGLTLLHDDLIVDASELRQLGWSPRYPFSEGWREVLRWYQAERWVPRYA
ncbi:MAG: NAD(P)-dependent oxidoreductase [Proteobacteria bacterium]|nr:NAD(P)-dependent oxidoreductase [Pseudomonadota bacterium]